MAVFDKTESLPSLSFALVYTCGNPQREKSRAANNLLEHSATHSNTPQHTATHRNTLLYDISERGKSKRQLTLRHLEECRGLCHVGRPATKVRKDP